MGFNEVANDLRNTKSGSKTWTLNWEPFMRKYRCNKVCELGIYKGDNFMEMIKHNPKLAVAVDSWKDNGIHPRQTDDYTQAEFDKQYRVFCEKVSNKPFVQIIRDTTVNAAKKFPNNFFDLVFIDADHTYNGCYNDLISWFPKVKPGKFLMGHDYAHRLRKTFGVFDAVNKFAIESKLEIIRFGLSNWALIKST